MFTDRMGFDSFMGSKEVILMFALATILMQPWYHTEIGFSLSGLNGVTQNSEEEQ